MTSQCVDGCQWADWCWCNPFIIIILIKSTVDIYTISTWALDLHLRYKSEGRTLNRTVLENYFISKIYKVRCNYCPVFTFEFILIIYDFLHYILSEKVYKPYPAYTQTLTNIHPLWHMQPHTVPTHSALVMAQQMTLCCLAAIYRTEKKWEGKNPISSLSLLPLSVCWLLLSQEASLKVRENMDRETQNQRRKKEEDRARQKVTEGATNTKTDLQIHTLFSVSLFFNSILRCKWTH